MVFKSSIKISFLHYVKTLFVTALLFNPQLGLARPSDHHDHNHDHNHHADEHTVSQSALGSHIHGEAELLMALEGERLNIQFHSPAMSLIGFEHKAQTEQEIQQLNTLKKTLTNPQSLFSFPRTDCQVSLQKIDIDHLNESSGKGNHVPSNDEHSNHDHDDHGHNPKNQKMSDSTHSDIAAHYVFNCSKAAPPKTIEVGIFNAFENLHKINAIWVSDQQQGAAELTPASNLVNLAP